MDISVKRIEIYRHGTEGLICKDNIRADIKVAFFVRVNKNRPGRDASGPTCSAVIALPRSHALVELIRREILRSIENRR